MRQYIYNNLKDFIKFFIGGVNFNVSLEWFYGKYIID